MRRETVRARRLIQHPVKTITSKVDQIVEAIADGIYSPALKERLWDLETRKVELEAEVAILTQDEAPIRLHPGLADIYRRKIADLAQALNHEATRAEAADSIRGLLSEVRMIPEPTAPDGHWIELHGDLAAILALDNSQKETPLGLHLGASGSMVAGAGCQKYCTLFEAECAI